MVTVSGTFTDIRNKLLAISAVVKYRKHSGWPPFQADEEWFYESEQDIRVCPICLGFERQQYFAGDTIPSEFPTREQIEPLHYVHPHVHQFYTNLLGECRCSLIWINPIETLRIRLEEEIREVA